MTTESQFRASVLPFTLHQEGGLSLDRHDAGNWTGGKVGVGHLAGTKYGISAGSYPHLDIGGLTLDEAKAIYWRDFVVKPGFDRLDLPLLVVVFDAGVNCGTGHAATWLRMAEKLRGDAARVASVTASNLAYHKRLKTWPRYGVVWGARIAACDHQARLLLAAAPVALPAHHPAPHPEAPRAAPKAATQAQAGLLAQLLRALFGALLHPTPKGPTA